MLKVIANLYSDSVDHFNEVATILKDNGYELAYSTSSCAIVVKEEAEESADE